MKCKNYTYDCNNATICPCLMYEECDNYCHSCRQDFVTTDEDELYYHHCKLDKNLAERKCL